MIYDRINLDNQCVWLVIGRKSVPMHVNMNIKIDWHLQIDVESHSH